MKKLLWIVVISLLSFSNAYAECIEGNCTNGKGIMAWPNGDVYIGEWKDGKTHGVGTLTWSYGAKYVGEWKDGKTHGLGKMTWYNGKFWEGTWKNGSQDMTKTFLASDLSLIHI